MNALDVALGKLREVCAAFPDKRGGEVTYSMADIGLSALSLFFMQSESFLSYQRSWKRDIRPSDAAGAPEQMAQIRREDAVARIDGVLRVADQVGEGTLDGPAWPSRTGRRSDRQLHIGAPVAEDQRDAGHGRPDARDLEAIGLL